MGSAHWSGRRSQGLLTSPGGPITHHHGDGRGQGQEGRDERAAAGIHLPVAGGAHQGGGRAQEAEGQAGRQEGDPRRAGEEAGRPEESRGGEDQEGGAGQEGGRGAGEEEADGGGREEKAGDARRPEGGRQEVFRSRHGRSQRDVQVEGAGGG